MDLQLHNQHVLITGGSKGIGLACAQAFLQEGAKVSLVSRDTANLGKARQTLQTQFAADRIHTVAADLRDAIEREGSAHLTLDLLPNHTPERVWAELQHPRGPRSLATHLKSRLGVAGLKLALLHEIHHARNASEPERAIGDDRSRSVKFQPRIRWRLGGVPHINWCDQGKRLQ